MGALSTVFDTLPLHKINWVHEFFQTSNKFTSPASEHDYSFNQFASIQCKNQHIKRARVNFIAVIIKQVKTIKQVDIDIKRAWLFIEVSVKSSSKSSEAFKHTQSSSSEHEFQSLARQFYNSSKCNQQQIKRACHSSHIQASLSFKWNSSKYDIYNKRVWFQVRKFRWRNIFSC